MVTLETEIMGFLLFYRAFDEDAMNGPSALAANQPFAHDVLKAEDHNARFDWR